MDHIVVDGESIDPYFILDVVKTDSEQFVTKCFRKKAKMWHPDKLSKQDAYDPIKVKKARRHFKVLVDSFEYIIDKIRSATHNHGREHVTIVKNDNLQTKSIDNTNELAAFHTEFDKLRVTTPNDFGYTASRMKDSKEYDNFEYTPYQLFDVKKFDNQEFNKTFEYRQQTFGQDKELAVYHKTNDGFNPYNGGDLNGLASVSSYNGLMIVGDTFGQSGVGYYDSSYSDYKQTFEAPKNPETNIKIPDNFVYNSSKIGKLSTSEAKKQLDLQMKSRNIDLSSTRNDKGSFKMQEQLLINTQQQQMQDKIEQDKLMILEYRDMYDPTVIQSALYNQLETSPDYINERSA